MKIYIHKIEEQYHYSIAHIVKLFFEDPELIFAQDTLQSIDVQEIDLQLNLRLNVEQDRSVAIVTLQDDKAEPISSTMERPSEQGKRALNLALLQALTEYTGVE